MARRTVTVASTVGLHARPAALFVKAASEQQAQVQISKLTSDGESDPVTAASILGVMTLGVEHGDQVVLHATGEDGQHAVDALAELLVRDLDG